MPQGFCFPTRAALSRRHALHFQTAANRDAAGVSITATELSLILGGVALSAKRRLRYAKSEKVAEC